MQNYKGVVIVRGETMHCELRYSTIPTLFTGCSAISEEWMGSDG